MKKRSIPSTVVWKEEEIEGFTIAETDLGQATESGSSNISFQIVYTIEYISNRFYPCQKPIRCEFYTILKFL